MVDARRRTPDLLDASSSDRATIIDVEPPRASGEVAAPSRGALTTFIARRLPFLSLPQEGRETRPFPFGRATFIAFVLVPSLAIVLYFAFIASNQYVAEMRLVVRMGRATGGNGGLSSIMGGQGGGLTGGGSSGGLSASSMAPAPEGGTSIENAYIVTSYIHSRAIVDEMVKTIKLREFFSRPGADFYARLPANATMENLTDYWRTMVRASLDPMSGIITVTVRAFRPEDAVEISKRIESLSEDLVNTISVRSRADALRRATEEVQRAQSQLLASFREMEDYRNREGMIDPAQSAKQTGVLLAKVLGDQLEAENQLFIASKSLSPDSASVRTLKTQAENLRRQAADLRAQLAGDEGQSSNVAAALTRFEEISVQQKLAQTLYTIAENGLERARTTAEAQSVYLSVFVQPGLPEDTTYPLRVQFTFLLTALLATVWGVGALIWASVEDHRMG